MFLCFNFYPIYRQTVCYIYTCAFMISYEKCFFDFDQSLLFLATLSHQSVTQSISPICHTILSNSISLNCHTISISPNCHTVSLTHLYIVQPYQCGWFHFISSSSISFYTPEGSLYVLAPVVFLSVCPLAIMNTTPPILLEEFGSDLFTVLCFKCIRA